MKLLGRRARVLVTASVLIALCACGVSNQAAPTSSAPGISAESINLGLMTDLTGGSTPGTEEFYGTQMAVAEINQHGGINGRKIQLTTEDSARTADGGILAMRKLIQQDGVFAVIAAANSAAVLPALPISESSKVPVLVTAAADTKIADPFNKYVFMNGLTGAAIAQIFTDYLSKTVKPSSVSLAVEDLVYSNDIRDRLKVLLPKAGIKLGSSQQMTASQTSYLPQAQALQQAGAPFVVMIGTSPRADAAMLIQMHRLNYRPQVLIHHSAASANFLQLAGADAEGITSSWATTKQFVDDQTGDMGRWRKAYSAAEPAAASLPVTISAVIGYTQVYVVAEAIRRSGNNPTREALVTSLESLKSYDVGKDSHFNYANPLGLPISYSKTNHQGSFTLTLLAVRNGAFVATNVAMGGGTPPAVSTAEPTPTR